MEECGYSGGHSIDEDSDECACADPTNLSPAGLQARVHEDLSLSIGGEVLRLGVDPGWGEGARERREAHVGRPASLVAIEDDGFGAAVVHHQSAAAEPWKLPRAAGRPVT